LSDKDLEECRNAKGVVGVYRDLRFNSVIAVIRNKTSFRDYAGVVISSEDGKWITGQVVLELKSGRDTLQGIMYDKYCIPENVALAIKSDALGAFIREEKKVFLPRIIPEELVASKALSTKTLYLKISTFNQGNVKNIDSLFEANKFNLNHMPYLILDLRNNGGGADFSFRTITPYLYTNPVRMIGADVLSTDDNIAGWTAISTTNGIPADQNHLSLR
jgi:hypothetical protein